MRQLNVDGLPPWLAGFGSVSSEQERTVCLDAEQHFVELRRPARFHRRCGVDEKFFRVLNRTNVFQQVGYSLKKCVRPVLKDTRISERTKSI